ncbi:MAG: SpoIIE family protein phosphatase [Anaerolineales bacterium]|nr:SpoIIE family protein phosphatase [Anaerolineales bacterium]
MNEKFIQGVPLFESLPEREIEHLAESLRPREIPKNTLLLNEGETGDHYYIIVEGQAAIIKALGTADERLLAIRETGSFLGEMSLFSEDGCHTASVRAISPLRLLEMSRKDLDELLSRHPSFAYEMMRILSLRLAESENLTIRDLRRKNRELLKAYRDLEAAQAQIIEKEKMERELEVARQIQMSILPRVLPQRPCLDFGAYIVPMTAVGGDFFQVIPLSEEKLGIAIGDVADHGVPAALFMAFTVTLLRAECQRTSEPSEVLRRVNHHLLEMNETGMFVTILYGIMDCNTREYTYSRAGHELPLLMRETGEIIHIDYDVGQPLGIFTDPSIDEKCVKLPSDSVLLMYTDGVTEAFRTDGKLYGLERLYETLRIGFKNSAQEICDSVWKSLTEFRQETAQHDDVTVLAIKVE